MPPYKSGYKKTRRNPESKMSGKFEVEDITRNSLCITQTHITNSQTRCDPTISSISSFSDNISSNSLTNNSSDREVSYLSLSLASDLVPRFDGQSTTCSIFKFIKQCQLANSLVKPNDQVNLLALIKNKIGGIAEQIINNRYEPTNLTELIDVLRSALIKNYNFDHIFDELKSLRQEGESVEIFGQKINNKLNIGLEAINEQFSSEQKTGVISLLNHTAVAAFLRGLRNQFISLIISKDQSKDLETVIGQAIKLDQETQERERHLELKNPFNAKIYAASTNNMQCYECQNFGHIKQNCPRNKRKMSDTYQTKWCTYCKRPGHDLDECFKKGRMYPNVNLSQRNSNRSTALNSRTGSHTGAMRSSTPVARANLIGSTSQ